MDVPEFPAAALKDHVDGTVWTWVQITPQGTVGKIDTEVSSAWSNASKLLVPAVEKVVNASKFNSQCYGKTAEVVYRYQLFGSPVANPKPTNHTEANIVFIESQPEMMAHAQTAKAAPKSK